MKYLKTYNDYIINEARGLSETSIIYSDIIFSEFNKHFEQFLKSNSNEQSYKIILNKNDLKDIIDNKNWPNFPVSEFELEFKIKTIPAEKFNEKYYETIKYKNWITNGAFYNLEDYYEGCPNSYLLSDGTIHLKMEIGVELSSEFNDKKGLEVEIESCILHELSHAYEAWVRKKSGHGQTSVDLTWSIDVNRPNIKKELFKIWSDNINLLYNSERHELRAMVQEAWSYVKKYNFDEMKEKCFVWKIAEQMSNFDALEFREEFKEKAKEIYPDINEYGIEFILKSLKGGLANELIQRRDETAHEDKPSIIGEKIKKMSLDSFFNFIQKRINFSGEKLKQKIMRLYSLK